MLNKTIYPSSTSDIQENSIVFHQQKLKSGLQKMIKISNLFRKNEKVVAELVSSRLSFVRMEYGEP